MSSFFIGYLIAHIPGGLIAEKYGGKSTLTVAILSLGICTIATPLSLEYGKLIKIYHVVTDVKVKSFFRRLHGIDIFAYFDGFSIRDNFSGSDCSTCRLVNE